MARTRRGSRSSSSGGMLGGRRPIGARQSSTMAVSTPTSTMPVQTHTQSPPPPPAQRAPNQPGLFSQMASTAAGVAVGSAVGHTIGAGITSLFSGNNSSNNSNDEAQQVNQNQAILQQQQQQPAVQDDQRNATGPCEIDARNFTRCLGEHNGELSPCEYYLQQLKACQEAARQY